MSSGPHDRVEVASDAGPVLSTDRISSLDVIRGVALFGILLLNVIGFGLPFAYNDPTNFGGAEGLNLIAWQTNALLFEGTMRGLFSLLFGAGVILITRRGEARGDGIRVADIYFRRSLWLIVFGLAHAWLWLWPGDILYIYGIAALLLFSFRNVRPRTLIMLGVLALASVTAKDWVAYTGATAAHSNWQAAQSVLDAGDVLDKKQQAAIDSWKEEVEDLHPPKEKIDEVIDEHHGHYFENIAANAKGIVKRQSYGLYVYSLWDALGMMFIGMALLKLGVLNAERSNGFYLALIALGYGIGVSVNYYEMKLLMDNNFDVLASAQSWLTYDVGRLPVTLGHVGLVMMICKHGWMRWLTSRIAAVGRMALTSYVTHTVICVLIFTGVGFALFGELQRYELYYVVFGIWVFQLIVSPVWLKYYRFGPLEWVWRSLTYNKRQPLRRI
jgi:uncharacterized protein